MTRDELQAKLTTKGVHESLYSLDGQVRRSECYCVVKENGTWGVEYNERGTSTKIAEGISQNEAFEFVYSKFRAMFGWKD